MVFSTICKCRQIQYIIFVLKYIILSLSLYAVIALQEVRSEDQRDLATIVSAAKANLYATSLFILVFPIC